MEIQNIPRGQQKYCDADELGLGFYFLSAIIFAALYEVYDAIPFLTLFAGGFFYISLVSFFQKYAAWPDIKTAV